MKAITRAASRSFSPRRAVTWGSFGAAWVGLRAVLQAGRAVDEVLFPEWRDQAVREPVFLFANGRSGTTMLHRLMSLDEKNFAGFKLYQSIFSAVAYQRFFQAWDKSAFGPVGRAGVNLINKAFFDGWQGIHELGIDKEEEDEALFAYALNSSAVSLLNPYMEDYEDIGWLDGQPADDRRRFMDFYEATLKKHLFSAGPEKRFLNKNVFFAPRIKTMRERFPDARFIYLVRHPYEALPSWLNMFYEKWISHSPELEHDSPQAKTLAQMSYAFYRYVLEVRAQIPAEQLRFVRYADLVRDPKRVVEEVYAWLGLELTPAYRTVLEAATSRQRRYKSKHSYSLEQFGLTKDDVYEELKDVFEAFGFER